jgi:hypothetical protein
MGIPVIAAHGYTLPMRIIAPLKKYGIWVVLNFAIVIAAFLAFFAYILIPRFQ